MQEGLTMKHALARYKRVYNQLCALWEMKKHTIHCKSRPHIIHFLSQYQCNYNCEFCGFDYRTQPIKEQLSFESYKTILKNLHPKKLTKIIFSGQGEPLLCRDLEPIVKYTNNLYPHIPLILNTNGELLNDENLSLVSKYFSSVILSLHSIKEPVYNEIVGKNSYKNVMGNLYALRKINRRIKISLYFSYSMQNIKEICDHVKLCTELERCSYIGAYTKFYSKKRQYSDKNNDSLSKTIDHKLSLYYHQEFSDGMIQSAMDLSRKIGFKNCIFPPLFSKKPRKRIDCSFPYAQILVNPDGQVFPCGGSDVLMIDEIESGKLNFGNLLESDIDEIWHLPDYKTLRASSAGSADFRLQKHCYSCSTLGFLVDSGHIKESHFVNIE